MTLKTNYKDYVASGNKKIKLNSVGNGVYEVTDSTTYTQTGDNIGATDLNNITTAVNTISENYISKSSASGYDDILTKTAASSTYATTAAVNNKADKSALGTQVTFSLSGTTLTITSK